MQDVSRRKFLQILTVAGGAVVLTPIAARAADAPAPPPAAPPALTPAVYWAKIGVVKDFPLNTVTAASYPAEFGGGALFVNRSSDTHALVLDARCTHKGCPVKWMADAKVFDCPCHHGKFTDTGALISGPPKKPLATIDAKIDSMSVVWAASATPPKSA